MLPTPGKWVGMSRNCAGALKAASQEGRLKACDQTRKFSKDGSVCEQARPYCTEFYPKLYQDFLRKQKAAMELFQHASDRD